MKKITDKLSSLFNSPWLVVFVGVMTIVITMRSILGPTFFRPHDFTHAARLVEMQRSLEAGEFPVRWSRNFGFGYGMPLFNFYAPLPYYVGQIPLALGLSAVDATKFLYLLNGVLAFAGMYLLGSRLWGKWGGLVSAVIFSFSTYRALDLFVRGALGEAFALVLIPFALYGVQVALEKKRLGLVIIATSLAATLLSHNLTGMISVVLVIVYYLFGIFTASKKDWKWQAVSLVISVCLALGLSAFYTLPAYFEKGLTRVDQTIVVGYFDYHDHFLCFSQVLKGVWKYGASLPGCSDDLSFAFGYVAWGLLATAVLSIFLLGKKKERLVSLLLLAVLFSSIFITIGRSVFIWDQIMLLKYFQFPWRFLTFSHVVFALLSGGVVVLVRKWRGADILLFVGVLILGLEHANYYTPELTLKPEQWGEYYNTSPDWIRTETSKTLNDYLPPEVKDSNLPGPVSTRFSIVGGSLGLQKDRSNLAQARVSCPKECKLVVNNFQFPGWSATVDGKDVELRKSEGNLPIYELTIPAGDHEVKLEFTGTKMQKMGNIVSVASLVFTFCGLVYCVLNMGKKK